MAYQWPIDPQDLFEERSPQMVGLGLPGPDVDAVRGAITGMWPDAPGGWVHEWSVLAERYATQGRHDLAYLAYGWAKFPALADGAKRMALAEQIREYELASPAFPVSFERRVLDVPYRGGTTRVPVHLLGDPGRPVLIASGGVDSWKMDIHPLLVQLVLRGAVRVLAFDHAGTGESAVPMTAAGGIEIVQGLIAAARALGDGRVGHFGFSMGGYFAAHSGLAGLVDGAVVLGGPVQDSFTEDNINGLLFGMADIVGNALGMDHRPTVDEISQEMSDFPLTALLDQDINAPMLVINGADDVHLPASDTLVFTGRRDTTVDLVPGTGHVAASKLPQVIPVMTTWLAQHFGRPCGRSSDESSGAGQSIP